MRETHRSGDEGQNFIETMTGEAPSSVEVSFSAKGVAQLTVKLYYPDVGELLGNAGTDVWSALYEVSHELAARGIQVSGIVPGAGEEDPE